MLVFVSQARCMHQYSVDRGRSFDGVELLLTTDAAGLKDRHHKMFLRCRAHGLLPFLIPRYDRFVLDMP